ncbi:hypothetical protein CASFOL_000730 [Castilleja foliolosa]|uniref:8-amino-7-oxononanoate synthase n=1 Tax=Castilleja foliolosa TaxID=1961234 RepID=A0ABD3EL56_9LAMI
MISFKAIQPFTPNHACQKDTFQKRKLVISLCASNNLNNPDEKIPPKGDSRKQDLLARIAMLQTQKVRLTDYLDERSDYLTQFAEEANAEIDQIGENALRELDEAGTRIMGNIENQMQAFEESMEMNKMENEENEKKVADFEGQIEKDRNEGLFFKNLGEKTPVDKAKAKEEAEKIRELTKKSAGSVIRRNIYIVLIGLVVIGIAEATVISLMSDWRKIGVFGVILVGLITQLVYEHGLLSETDEESKRG